MRTKITDCCLIITCLLLAVVVVQKNYFPARQKGAPEFKIGQVVKIPGLIPNKPAVVLAISTQCGPCQEAIPLFHEIGTAKKVVDGSIQVIDILPQQREASIKYLADNRIPGTLSSGDFRAAGFSLTPTLMYLNKQGAVEQLWEGEPHAGQRTNFLALLN
jgi:thiol-disulfide isomerase/thioredoxin